MAFESQAEAIKLGVLMDWVVPEDHPKERLDDFFLPLELVFKQGLEDGVIDRPVELVVRQTWGLPKGSVKAVIDAFGELIDEGCLAVYGPGITDNCIPTREAIEERFHVPAISMTGADDWLGEWTFSLPQGSLTEEPIFWAELLAKGGHTDVGALIEQSLVGDTYIRNFRKACGPRASTSSRKNGSPRRRMTSVTPSATCMPPRSRLSCTAASVSVCSTSARHYKPWHGIRRGSWERLSKTPGSTTRCGEPCSAGPALTSTTRAIRWANAFWTTSRLRTDAGPSGWCR